MSAYCYLMICVSLAASGVIAYAVTPVVIWLARKTGAIDIPKDDRRMHKRPIPSIGGLAIIFAFIVTSFIVLIMLHASGLLVQIIPGAVIIGVLGLIDDKYNLPAWPKFFVQCLAASTAVALGVRIQTISGVKFLHISPINLDFLSIPLTIIWIVGLTNAMNFIDGLDGLADGVSIIASMSMLVISLLRVPTSKEFPIAVLTAALTGGAVGVLPYNRNPAKIFIGDTGATFLGFTLSIISIQGLFKFYGAISVAVPFLVLGLPILDATIAIFRRLSEGKSPFTADRNHLHHKLIDLGLNQKQAVAALYIVSAIMGLVAIVSSLVASKISWLFFFGGLILVFLIFVGIRVVAVRKSSEDKDK